MPIISETDIYHGVLDLLTIDPRTKLNQGFLEVSNGYTFVCSN